MPASPFEALSSPSPAPRPDWLNDDRLREAGGKSLKILVVGGQHAGPTVTRGEDNVCVDDVRGLGRGQQRSNLMSFFTGEADNVAAAKEPSQLHLAW
jgi:hypothetical protein